MKAQTPTIVLAAVLALGLVVRHLADLSGVAEPPEVAKVPDVPAGLVVHLGTTDGRSEAELAARDGWVVLGLALEPEAGAKARAFLADKGLLGRATVHDLLDPKRLPLVSNSAAVLIADLDQHAGRAPDEKELLRAVRPLGTLRLRRGGKWQDHVKLWPKEFDDWPMYFHDAAGTDVSRDTAVGPVRGLQWHTGDGATNNKFGLRSKQGVLVSYEEAPAPAARGKNESARGPRRLHRPQALGAGRPVADQPLSHVHG